MKEIIKRIIDKALSGRFILVLSAAYVFAKLAEAGKLPQAFVSSIITMVFTLYFTRQDRNINVEKRRENLIKTEVKP